MNNPDPRCPDGRPCVLNLCGAYSPKSPPLAGCFRRRLDSYEAVQKTGAVPVYDSAADVFVAKQTRFD